MESNEIKSLDLLETILTASKQAVQKGKGYAEDALNIPDAGIERDNKIDGLKKGAIASAVLFGLLGTKGGRSITGKAIKIGGIAALGTAAYKGYKHWRNNQTGISVHELTGIEAQERALLLITAMVSAANADGKLDDQESAILKREILDMNLSESLFGDVSQIVENPLSCADLCDRINDDAVASEVYITTRLFIDDESSELEQTYLNDLVEGLGLSDELVDALESELVRN